MPLRLPVAEALVRAVGMRGPLMDVTACGDKKEFPMRHFAA